ncbi:hypothetical protein TNCV_5034201 [Trichonephila clavipes]|nr:hypothetical protein TNCV_5034201 [Trichonephila clavipes]
MKDETSFSVDQQRVSLSTRVKSGVSRSKFLCGSFPPGGTTASQLLHRSIICQVANMVAKNDDHLALSPTFRYVSIESPL